MPRRLLAIVLTAVTAAVAAPPATLPTTTPSADPDQFDRAALTAEHAAMPRRAATLIGRVLSIKVEDGNLHVRSLLPPGDGPFTMDVVGWPGFVDVKSPADGTTYEFHHLSVGTDPHDGVDTVVITREDYLQLCRMGETANGMTNVTLIQARQFADDNGDPVRLTVQVTHDADAPGTNLRLGAASFAELCQAHPAEVREYLLPVLRDLGAASVLRHSDPTVAWQVLGPDIEPDPALVRRLDAAMADVNADDFKTRAKAEETLVALGPPGAAALRRRDLTKLSPDARSAAENAIGRNTPLPADRAAALERQPTFLLDTLLLDEPGLATAAAARLEKITGRPLDLPASLSASERASRVDALRGALAPTTTPTR